MLGDQAGDDFLSFNTSFSYEILPEIDIQESPMSRDGLGYLSTTGEPIKNKGQQRLHMKTKEGHKKVTTSTYTR